MGSIRVGVAITIERTQSALSSGLMNNNSLYFGQWLPFDLRKSTWSNVSRHQHSLFINLQHFIFRK